MAQVKSSRIWAMLDECAKGYVAKEKKHRWWVTFNGKTFRRMPLGKHGARFDPEVQIGKVRGLVTHLEINLGCVAKHFPELAEKTPLPQR